ncbi:PREDICTED: probable inactive serine/threonine-protein kinase bub1 isoform X1 [Theobroma cacao]|uniref:Probable inactive serine/threonine-protein kinase bub1 isoform X1 n=1 Tax=Theobroma cacao TaxID=3641 RepID=A0AB32UL45_THECC|nr:PREDICTED: probable inactive serine/threonine-protein kinase bub1 isoform X1 [Theobroma cacao]
MAEKNETMYRNLFSSVISEIKSYSGKDPLLPWLRGIKKMKESLPPEILNEKLPRFLQKCTQTFESDRRYRNDLRYLRVWLQLMDFVDEPRLLLRRMEMNHIGTKRSLYYQAYALYYEKIKKFDEAETMYHLGVQNLAEPVDELQKSYEQFLNRMERHKKKKIQRQEGRTARRPLQCSQSKENSEGICIVEDKHKWSSALHDGISKKRALTERELDEPRRIRNDDTVGVKFVDTAIVGKSEAEDACHHGLVDPTINMKEAMNAINSMFREPLETAPIGRRSHRRQQKEDCSLNSGFRVFDANLDSGINSSIQPEEKGQKGKARTCQAQEDSFKIYVDDEEDSEAGEGNDEKDNLEQIEVQNSKGDSMSSASHLNMFVFPCPNDSPESSDDVDAQSSRQPKLREDTVVHRFVGSTISDEPVVENVCHHGLVDPTINLKEAMQDINSMFGKPIDFVRAKRKKQEKAPVNKNQDVGGFSILPDDELENQERLPPSKSSAKLSDCDLFEPTVFTKEAMDDINKMFGMPLDF